MQNVPDILEQDLTEEERKRLEQEAARAELEQLLATRIEPPDSQLPQTAIPAENVSFTNGANGQIQIDTPEGFAPTFDRQMIGDERYQQEVARAQRGNGFLNADVGPAGNTIVPGYDPAIAEAAQYRQQAKLAAQAERFMGVQGYQQSIQSGATPAEALALWGQKMYAGDPEALASVVTRREPVARVPVHKPQWGKPTRAALAQDNNFAREIGSLRSQLAKGGLGGLPLDPAEANVIKAQIAAKEQQRVQALERPEFNPNVDLTGIDLNRWNNPPARPDVGAKQAAAPAKADEQVVVVKDGRRYSLPKSQLDEALKAGYKQQ